MEKVFDIAPTEGLRQKKCAFLPPLEVMAETRQEQLFLALEFGIEPGLVDAGCFFKRLKVGSEKPRFQKTGMAFSSTSLRVKFLGLPIVRFFHIEPNSTIFGLDDRG